MKKQTSRQAKRIKKAKERDQTNLVQPEHTVKIQLQMPSERKSADWYAIQELWRRSYEPIV